VFKKIERFVSFFYYRVLVPCFDFPGDVSDWTEEPLAAAHHWIMCLPVTVSRYSIGCFYKGRTKYTTSKFGATDETRKP